VNYKKLNILSDIYFSLILSIGISYITFLIFSFVKIFPGFAMQIIFLLDSFKFNNDIVALIISQIFLVNFIPGLLLFALILQFIKSIISLFKNIWQTKILINNLAITKTTNQYFIFNSKQLSVFTLGFLKPKIFISSSVFKTHNPSEINSIILHEINHQKNLHPLKIFISNFIKSFTPPIIGKNWLFDSYLTSTEVSSDVYSQNITNTNKPLVSALLKFQNQSFEVLPASISYFNSQSERIKILTGHKGLIQHLPMIYSSLVMVLIMASVLSIKNSNFFYECQHLIKCVETLMMSNSQPLIHTLTCS